MPSATSEPVSIQQAFDAAKEEHSQKEQAPPPEASTEQAKTDIPPTQDTAAAGASPESATTDNPDLISDADFAAIQSKFPGDPAKQRAELNRHWTQKTQALADERKQLEPHRQLLDALETDFQGTVTQLAERAGLKLAPSPAEAATTQTATTIADAAVAQVRQHLGPDYEFLAEPLTRAMHGVAEAVAKAVTDQAVAPLKAKTDEILDKAAAGESDAVMKGFTEKHPDWKTHEPAMVKLSQSLLPGKDMSQPEYLEHLYRMATYDQSIAAAGAKAVQRLTRAAESAEKEAPATSTSQVKAAPPANATLTDAFAAAKRGEVW